ncbi:MAG: hypothetical protein WA474_19800 [Candidatus Sulfotelmatobacter sp.]
MNTKAKDLHVSGAVVKIQLERADLLVAAVTQTDRLTRWTVPGSVQAAVGDAEAPRALKQVRHTRVHGDGRRTDYSNDMTDQVS